MVQLPAQSEAAERVDLTAIIVSYNTADLLLKSTRKLKSAAANLSLTIVVVDNASKDNSVALIHQALPDCELIVNDVNVGFGRANNQALPLVMGRYVLLLNTDAFVAPDALEKTIAYMEAHPRCGILGVKLVGRDGRLQPCARYFPTPWNLFLARTGLKRFFSNARMVDDMDWDHGSVRACDWIPGCFYLVRRQVIEQVGLFDPRYFLYYEEVDHCRAAKKMGWEVVFFPETTVVHIGGESARSDGEITQSGRQIEALQIESELLYFRKNHGLAGVLLHVFLTSVGCLVLAIKALVRPASVSSLRARVGQVARMWRLFARTGCASRPTR